MPERSAFPGKSAALMWMIKSLHRTYWRMEL